MKLFNRSISVFLLTLGLTAAGSIPALASGNSGFQDYPAPYSGLRELVDRTQSDLRAAADLEHGNDKQRDRYHNAQGHLSTFDRNLVKGKFDKGELQKSIDEIHNILEHNVLQASSRDALLHDETDLKLARDRRYEAR